MIQRQPTDAEQSVIERLDQAVKQVDLEKLLCKTVTLEWLESAGVSPNLLRRLNEQKEG